jgi:hypothetical protein
MIIIHNLTSSQPHNSVQYIVTTDNSQAQTRRLSRGGPEEGLGVSDSRGRREESGATKASSPRGREAAGEWRGSSGGGGRRWGQSLRGVGEGCPSSFGLAVEGLGTDLEGFFTRAAKKVYSKLVKTGYPDKIWEIRKQLGYKPNRFRPVFEFDILYFVMGISLCTWSLWAGCFSQHFLASWTAFRAGRTAVLEQQGQQHLDYF